MTLLLVALLAAVGTKPLELPPLVPETPPSAASESISPTRAAEQWGDLLRLGRYRGGSEEQAQIEKVIAEPATPFVRALGLALIEEWRFPSNHPKLRHPRQVWLPPPPPFDKSAPPRRVRGESTVSSEGRATAAEIRDSSGRDEIDFAVVRWLRDARYRPALDPSKNRWMEDRDIWTVVIKGGEAKVLVEP